MHKRICCIVFVMIGCSGMVTEIGQGAGSASGSAGAAGGSGGAGKCTLAFDPVSGAEDDECTKAVTEPLCGTSRCHDDGLCWPDHFPMGVWCGDGMVCDGKGHCGPALPCVPLDCDDQNPCTLNYCNNGHCSNPNDTSAAPCGSGGHCYVGQCCGDPDAGAGTCWDIGASTCVVQCPVGQHCSGAGTCVND